MKGYLKILHIAAGWAFLPVWLGGLAGCFIITVPVKTAVSVTGTVGGKSSCSTCSFDKRFNS